MVSIKDITTSSVHSDKKPAAITPGKKTPPGVVQFPRPSAPPGRKPPPATSGLKSPPASAIRHLSSASQYAQKQTQFNFEPDIPDHPLMEPLRPPEPLRQMTMDRDYGQDFDDPDPETITAENVMHHILYNMLGEKITDGPIRSAFELGGVIEPHGLMLMDVNELETERSPTGKYLDPPVPLKLQQASALKNLQLFHAESIFEEELGGWDCFLPYEQWLKITQHDLMSFSMKAKKKKYKLESWKKEIAMDEQSHRSNIMDDTYLTDSDVDRVYDEEQKSVEYEENVYQHDIQNPPVNNPPRPSFLKGIKRDGNAYDVLKEDRYYDSWIRSVHANGKLHGVGVIFDPHYIPRGADAKAEFEEMQIFMWAMLTKCLKTSSGKQLCLMHDNNPQTIFAKLHQELKQSQQAEHSADDLHERIKALAIGKWTGSHKSFLEHWSTQLYIWCGLVRGTRTEPADVEKKKMLKTSVSSSAIMASIATQENIEIAKGNGKWTYQVYYNILMKAAIDDDRSKKRTAKGTTTKSHLNKAERTANSATQGRGGGRGRGQDGGRGKGRGGRGGRGGDTGPPKVPYDTWIKLTPEVQKIITSGQSDAKRTNAQHRKIHATQMAYGAIQLPDALWSQLPPGAQTAITTHNNTLSSGRGATTQANMHTQMHNATQTASQTMPQQVFGAAPPVNNQVQQAHVHGQ